MITIPVRVCGDSWVNPAEVESLLESHSNEQYIILDFQAEGPSLRALGIADYLERYCAKFNRDPKTISLTNISNQVEQFELPYANLNYLRLSHFFGMSKTYWKDQWPAPTHEYKFGFFLGRRTISRAKILYDLWHNFKQESLLSCMKTPVPLPWTVNTQVQDVEKLDHWVNNPEEFTAWWANCPVSSLDNHWVQDQYIQNPTTNKDILDHYHRFDVELVAESYTLGNTFFPTEKTVRPIMAVKPFIVYGPRQFLQRLRDMGFKTYSEFWDESYDELEGPARWQAITNLLPQINYDPSTNLVAEFNRAHLGKIIQK